MSREIAVGFSATHPPPAHPLHTSNCHFSLAPTTQLPFVSSPWYHSSRSFCRGRLSRPYQVRLGPPPPWQCFARDNVDIDCSTYDYHQNIGGPYKPSLKLPVPVGAYGWMRGCNYGRLTVTREAIDQYDDD